MSKPLQLGLSVLIKDLFNTFSNSNNTPFLLAKNFSDAVYNYSTSGSLDIEVKISQGTVTSFITTGPILGSGEGYMLSSNNKRGLVGNASDKIIIDEFANKLELAMTVQDSFIKSNNSKYIYGSNGDFIYNGAKTPLTLDDTLVFNEDKKFWTEETRNVANTGPYKKSMFVALAIHDFWKNSKFLTREVTPAPLPVAAPSGPLVVAGMIGAGGLGSSLPGTGFSAARSVLNQGLFDIFNDLSLNSISNRCRKIANLFYDYFMQASITSTLIPTTLSATVDITTGIGNYNSGNGKSIGKFI